MIQPTYFIYSLSFEKNGKEYIGYTADLKKRLVKHLYIASKGSSTKIARAIRKYGASQLKMKVLFTTKNKEEAKNKEKELIVKRDSINKGYNITNGGDGGDTFSNNPNKEDIRKKYKEARQKENSNRWSGFSDEFLINEAASYFSDNGHLGRKEWAIFSKEKGYPQNFSKNRFTGKFSVFVERVKERLNELGVNYENINFDRREETYTKQSRKKISDKISGRSWYNDGENDYQRKPDDPIIKKLKLKKGRLYGHTNSKKK